MSFLSAFAREERSVPIAQYSGNTAIAIPRYAWGPGGRVLDKETALTCSGIFAAIRILTGIFSTLPWKTFKRNADGSRKEHKRNNGYKIMRGSPNVIQTTPQWLRFMFIHTLLGGNSFSFLEFDPVMRLQRVVPMPADRVQPYQTPDGEDLIYGYRPAGTGQQEMFFPRHTVLHWPGIHSLNGITGESLISAAARTMGLGIAQEEYAALNMEQRATPSGALKYPQKLSEEGYAKIQKSIKDFYQGPKNAGNVLILDNGLEWQQLGFSSQDLDLVAQKKFGIADLSRFTGCTLQMLGESGNSSYASLEMDNLQFLQYTLGIWMADFAAVFNKKVYLFEDFEDYFVEGDPKGLLKMDFEKQMKGFATGINWGIYSPNDVRRDLNEPPLPPELGGNYYRPVNMVPADTPVQAIKSTTAADPNGLPKEEKPEEKPEIDEKIDEKRAISALKRGFEDVFERIQKKEKLKIEQIEKSPEQRAERLASWLIEQQAVYAEMIEPFVLSVMDALGMEGELKEHELRMFCRAWAERRTNRVIVDYKSEHRSPPELMHAGAEVVIAQIIKKLRGDDGQAA